MRKEKPTTTGLPGMRYGKLIVVKEAPRTSPTSLKRRVLCRCDCGGVATVQVGNLVSSHTVSCGCALKEFGRNKATHGGSRHVNGKQKLSPEFTAWRQMMGRCYRPKSGNYKDYGGRGITVCDEWKSNFANFLRDMGRRPDPNLTLDRIDNSKGYSKENCRWATRSEQMRNTRRSVWVEVCGQRKVMVDWSKLLGIPYRTLQKQKSVGGVAGLTDYITRKYLEIFSDRALTNGRQNETSKIPGSYAP